MFFLKHPARKKSVQLECRIRSRRGGRATGNFNTTLCWVCREEKGGVGMGSQTLVKQLKSHRSALKFWARSLFTTHVKENSEVYTASHARTHTHTYIHTYIHHTHIHIDQYERTSRWQDTKWEIQNVIHFGNFSLSIKLLESQLKIWNNFVTGKVGKSKR
jgi:hypothetical protein